MTEGRDRARLCSSFSNRFRMPRKDVEIEILELSGTLLGMKEYRDTETKQRVQIIYYTDIRNNFRKLILDSSKGFEREIEIF